MVKFKFDGVNDEQKEAITNTEGPVLITSPSGNGKTYTLIKRAVYLLVEKGIKPEQILITTFTEKSAKEIINGISNELLVLGMTFDSKDMYIGTFNSICLRILKENYKFSNFNIKNKIINKDEQQQIIYENISRFKSILGYDQLFSNSTSIWRQAGQLNEYMNKIREEIFDIKQILKDADIDTRVIGKAIEIYNDILKNECLTDSFQVNIEVLRLFENTVAIAGNLINKIKYIMIDEYEKINYIQEEIIFILGIDKENICVAGDDTVQRYTFRGSPIRSLYEFPYKFSINKCKEIKLTTRYKEYNVNNKTNTSMGSIHEDVNYILYGPPGTGKTYNTINYAVAFIENKDIEIIQQEEYTKVRLRYEKYMENGQINFTTFHQSYGYEDFIEGIKPNLDGKELNYKLEDGIFKLMCKRARDDEDNFYVIIIDEINRGNISRIFGELITLIEKSKRRGKCEEIKTTLPYSKTEFSVPQNIFILGTMNTADRSIALLDTALRRRFKFIEMLPNEDVIRSLNNQSDLEIRGVNINKMLSCINRRIEVLYDRDHTIGHSFFMELIKDGSIKKLETIFKGKIIPLLQEYFHDDYEKIRLVLADNQTKNKEIQFITVVEIENNLFGQRYSIDEYANNMTYKINIDAFSNPESYIKIYNGN